MKVIAYKIDPQQKEYLVRANAKVHELTFISNDLNEDTLSYATGKEVIVLNDLHAVNCPLLDKLKYFGIRIIISRSGLPSPALSNHASELGLKILGVNPALSQKNIAEKIIQSFQYERASQTVNKGI